MTSSIATARVSKFSRPRSRARAARCGLRPKSSTSTPRPRSSSACRMPKPPLPRIATTEPARRTEQFDRMNDARERLEKRALDPSNVLGFQIAVAIDDAPRHGDRIRIRTQDHRRHDRLAELLLRVATPKARAAGRRVDAHHGIARLKRRHALTDRGNLAGKLVAEAGRHRHLRVAATVGLQIRAVGQRGPHAHDDAARLGPWRRFFTQFDPLRLYEHRDARTAVGHCEDSPRRPAMPRESPRAAAGSCASHRRSSRPRRSRQRRPRRFAR